MKSGKELKDSTKVKENKNNGAENEEVVIQKLKEVENYKVIPRRMTCPDKPYLMLLSLPFPQRLRKTKLDEKL